MRIHSQSILAHLAMASLGGRVGNSPRLRVVEEMGRLALVVDGVTVSVGVPNGGPPSGYWAAMLPDGAPHRVLILGLGGGTLAHLLSRRHPGVAIVGVDADRELVEFAIAHFGLAVPGLGIVIGDAVAFVATCDQSFDYIAVDLFRGYQLEQAALRKPFLRGLGRILREDGEVLFNLFRDRRLARRLARLRSFFTIARVDDIGRNVVVHVRCQRL